MYAMCADGNTMKLRAIRITESRREQNGKIYRRILPVLCAASEKIPSAPPDVLLFGGAAMKRVYGMSAVYPFYQAFYYCRPFSCIFVQRLNRVHPLVVGEADTVFALRRLIGVCIPYVCIYM